ncbi:MAG: hypothetical protein COB36_14620 [Alphaproteobacteria bacterium]|nr:MAG: hypothetical protein COB36_14620 [Alphaproteobacteria bacterium]
MHKRVRKQHEEDTSETKPLSGADAMGSVKDLYQTYFRDLCLHVQASFGSGPPDPEDVAQDTFSKFAELQNTDHIQYPRAFLWRMANNIVISWKRREKSHLNHVTEEKHTHIENIVDVLTAERVLLGKEALSMVRTSLKKMPKFRRRVLLLNRLHNLSAAEISRRMNVPVTTVKTNIYRAMEDLEADLDQLDQQ